MNTPLFGDVTGWTVLYDLAFALFWAAAGFAGALVARAWTERRRRRAYGGWTIRCLAPDGTVLTERAISTASAEEILQDDTKLSQYVKGIASPYGFIKVDPVEEGRQVSCLDAADQERRLLHEDHDGRRITIDLYCKERRLEALPPGPSADEKTEGVASGPDDPILRPPVL